MLYHYKLTFCSYEIKLLGTYCERLNDFFNNSIHIKKINSKNLTVTKTKKTVLSSPHVNKSAREQFEELIHSKTVRYTIHPDHNEMFLIILHSLLTKNSSNIYLKVEVISEI
jgi:ribosomal protein S10